MTRFALIDVDGVCADTTGALMRALGVAAERFPTVWDWFSWAEGLGIPQRVVEGILLERSFWRDLPLIPNASAGVDGLRDDGYRLLFLTSPWWLCDGWETDRRGWLMRNMGAGPEDVVITSHKHLVRGDLFLDDRPDHVRAWAEANPTSVALLYDQPYNVAAEGLPGWVRRMQWGPGGLQPAR